MIAFSATTLHEFIEAFYYEPTQPTAINETYFEFRFKAEEPKAVAKPQNAILNSAAEWISAAHKVIYPHSYYKDYDFSHSRRIGEGSQGYVFSATKKHQNETLSVAIKVLKNPAWVVFFQREIANIRFMHEKGVPNVVQLLDVFENFYAWHQSNVPFSKLAFVMPDCGRTLHDAIRYGGNFTLPHFKYFAKQMLKTLVGLQKSGKTHGDFTSKNIFIHPLNSTLTVGDWYSSETVPAKWKAEATTAGPWRSPENVMGYPEFDCAIDMWAFGVILMEMSLKKYPYSDGDDFERMKFIVPELGLPSTEYVKKSKQGGIFFTKVSNGYQFNWIVVDLPGEILQSAVKAFARFKPTEMDQKNYADLVSQTQCWEGNKRIDAEKALLHPFFQDEKVNK